MKLLDGRDFGGGSWRNAFPLMRFALIACEFLAQVRPIWFADWGQFWSELGSDHTSKTRAQSWPPRGRRVFCCNDLALREARSREGRGHVVGPVGGAGFAGADLASGGLWVPDQLFYPTPGRQDAGAE